MESPAHRRCHICWNLEPYCTCPQITATPWTVDLSSTPRSARWVVVDPRPAPLTREGLEALIDEANRHGLGSRPPHQIVPVTEQVAGREPDAPTYDQFVASRGWRIHQDLVQRQLYGGDGIPFDFDPVAEAESFLR